MKEVNHSGEYASSQIELTRRNAKGLLSPENCSFWPQHLARLSSRKVQKQSHAFICELPNACQEVMVNK